MYNQHENELYVLGSTEKVVPKNHWVRVDGRVVRFLPSMQIANAEQAELHFELDDPNVEESLPRLLFRPIEVGASTYCAM